MFEPEVYRLSSLDQSQVRSYIRCCYCFSRHAADPTIDEATLALKSSTQRVIQKYPILAGSVVAETGVSSTGAPLVERKNQDHSRSEQARGGSAGVNTFALLRIRDEADEDDTKTEQFGRLKVLVTPNSHCLEPRVKILNSREFPRTYGELVAQDFPPSAFIEHNLTPLPDEPDRELGGNPVFAVQANFINGGVIVVLFLHHAVADVYNLAHIVQCMTNDKGVSSSKLAVQSDAREQSRSRDRLSGTRGVKARALQPARHLSRVTSPPSAGIMADAGRSRVLAFDLDKVEATAKMLNERSALMLEEPIRGIMPLECLTSIFWKSLARARRHRVEAEKDQMSTLQIPVDMRMRLDPPLGVEYFGNACISARVAAQLLHLDLPFDVGTLGSTACAVHDTLAAQSEAEVRATIAAVNDSSDVRVAIDSQQVNSHTDVLVTDWSRLPAAAETTLGLGLGPADTVREVSREPPRHGFLILPTKPEKGVWEVAAQLDEETMSRLLEDVGLRPFLLHVA